MADDDIDEGAEAPRPSQPVYAGIERKPRARRKRHRRLGVGDSIGKCFRLWGANFGPYLLLSLIVFLPLILYATRVTLAKDDVVKVQYELIATWATPILTQIVTATVMYGVFQQLQGHRPSLGQSVGKAFARLVPVLFVVLLCSLAGGLPAGLVVFFTTTTDAGGGSIILFLLGLAVSLFIYFGLIVAVPVCVVERPGVFASMKRSWTLMKGSRMNVFAIMLVFGLLTGIPGFIVGFLAVEGTDSYRITMLALQVLTVSLGAVLTTVVYHDLRSSKEGIDTAQLAAVFQ